MLGKMLLTAAVVGIAFFIIRQRHISERSRSQALSGGPAARGKSASGEKQHRDSAARESSPAANREDPGLAQDLRVGAYLFLIMMVGLAGVMYYFQWQDDRTIITVTLYRDGAQQPVTYEVYKSELGERSFTTVDGVAVTVAASERMEIVGLDN